MLWVLNQVFQYYDLWKYVPSSVQVSEALRRKESLNSGELMCLKGLKETHYLHHHPCHPLQRILLLQDLLKDCVGVAEVHWYQTT